MTVDLGELAERVEKLDGASRQVDAEIAALTRCGADPEWGWAFTNYPAWVPGANGIVHLEKNGPTFEAPAYTASIDAAMSLVPEGWAFGISSNLIGPGIVAGLQRKSPYAAADAEAATPALALVSAALRASLSTPNREVR